MELLRWKTKMSILWIIQAVAFAGLILLALLGSGAIKGLMETQISEGIRFVIAVFFFIPCIMAWFCLILKDSANRWLSFVLGILFAVIKLLSMSGVLSSAGVPAAIRFNEFWGFLAALLIIWYAWKWPKQEA
jgi:hypothetical protein